MNQKLKRYQAFCLPSYYPNGGSGDVVGEGETMEELAAALIAADRDEVDELLDLQEREWLGPAQFEPLLAEIKQAYYQKHPRQPPTEFEKETLRALMFGNSAEQPRPLVYRNYEESPFFDPKNPR